MTDSSWDPIDWFENLKPAERGFVEKVIAERDEARAFGEEAARKYNELLEDQRILRCAFCDHEYPPDTPPTQHEALTAHVMECEKHPLKAERDEALSLLREVLPDLVEIYPFEGPRMKRILALLGE